MNRLAMIIATGAALLCAGQAAEAARPMENAGLPALSTCPTTLQVPTIYHFDKVEFVLTGALLAVTPADQASLNNLPRSIELDVKLRDSPIKVANLRAKVLSFLGAVVDETSLNVVQILEVSYAAVVCPASTTPPT